MDVLHVIHQFPPETNGGSESYALALAKLQRAAGLDAQVLTGSMHKTALVELDRYEHEGVPVYRIHRDDEFFDHHVKAWHPGISARFGELLDELRPRVVHMHQWVRLSNDLVATAHTRSVPAVVQLHDMYTSCPRAFRARPDDPACMRPVSGFFCWNCVPRYGHEPREELEEGVDLFAASLRRELALAHTVLVAVPAIADILAHVSAMPRERYRTLTLGYEPRFVGMDKLAAPAPGERFRFAYWGGVGRHKGVHVLVQAMAKLPPTSPPCELHVLGGFESEAYENELRALAEGLPVTFHGRFTAEQLHAVRPHCGVFPSMCLETFGFVLDECFELGLPCITSDIGALPARSQGAGLTTRAGDSQSIANVMDRLMRDRPLYEQLRAGIPAPGPTMVEHSRQIAAIYQEAWSTPAPVPCAPEVPWLRRVRFLMQQRDTAFSGLMPKHGVQ
jgi:glycosyltransferase involved in cell wall biosynthesis